MKMNGVTEDVIKMKLYLFSLRDKDKGWLQSLHPSSMNSGSWTLKHYMRLGNI